MNRIICNIILTITLTGCIVANKPTLSRINEAQSMVERGVDFLRSGDLDSAEASFQVASEIETLPEAFDGLGCVAFLRGEYQLAEKVFTGVLKSYPEYTQAKMNLALLYDILGERELSHQFYTASLIEAPQNPILRNNFGVMLNGSDDKLVKKEGNRLLKQAFVLAPYPLIEINLAKSGNIQE